MGLKVFGLMNAEECGTQRKVNPYKLNDEDIDYLFGIFKTNKHYNKLYIDINGKYYLNAYTYDGDFAEWKDCEGKKYAMMNTQPKTILDKVTRLERRVKMPIPNPEFEIAAEYTKEQIENLKNKN